MVDKREKKRLMQLIAVIIAAIVLLFGDNIVGRVLQKESSLEQKEDNTITSDSTINKEVEKAKDDGVYYNNRAHYNLTRDLQFSGCECFNPGDQDLDWFGSIDVSCNYYIRLSWNSRNNDLFIIHTLGGGCITSYAQILSYDPKTKRGEILIPMSDCDRNFARRNHYFDKVFQFIIINGFDKILLKGEKNYSIECIHSGEAVYKFDHESAIESVPHLEKAHVEEWKKFFN